MKIIILLLITYIYVNAKLVVISNKNINYNEIIDINNLKIINYNNTSSRCKKFDINLLLKEPYQAKHFIFKGKAICNKDVKKVILNKIEYDFGNIVIQRNGKIISETNKYVKIKNANGSIEKIYKNGQK